MSTFVLVHGAWQGASTWDLIVPKLQTAGHKVFVPVLTGLGEDSHRLSSTVNLESHIDDVRARLCDFSLRCFEQKVRLPSNAAAMIEKTFIAAVAQNYPARFVFERFGERARREHWDYYELSAGHDCHVETPDKLVSLLLAD